MSDVRLSGPAQDGGPPLQPGLLKDARRALGQHFGLSDGWIIDVLLRKGPKKGGRPSHLKATHPSLAQVVVIKMNTDHARNVLEFKALQTLHQVTGACAAPLFIDDAGNFFGLEWIDAPTVLDQISGPEHGAALARTGAWLARLHSVESREPFLVRKRSLLHLGYFEQRGAVAVATARLRACRRHARVSAGPIALLHGDFHAGNVFDLGDRVLAIDRVADFYGPAFQDVARFLSDLESRRELAALEGQPWPFDADTDRRHFFEGYGPIQEAQLALFDLVEDMAFFRLWRRSRQRGNVELADQMRARGLLGPLDKTGQVARPGRLVAATSGDTRWTQEPAPEHRQSFSERLRGFFT